MKSESQEAEVASGSLAEVPTAIQGKSLITSATTSPEKATPKTDEKSRKRTKPESSKPVETASYFASDIHKYIREQIALADQKAVFLFAASGSMLAYLHSKNMARSWLKDPRQWQSTDAIACVAVLGLTIGAIAAVVTVLPRFKGASRGIVFWKSIALFETKTEYANHVLTAESTTLTSAKLEHCFELAQVCKRKYRAVGLGLWGGGIGLLGSVLYLILS
jgi:hypothetical protein